MSEQPDLFKVEKKPRVRTPDPLRLAVVQGCHIDPAAYGGWGRIEKELKPLRTAALPATPERIEAFLAWYRNVLWGRVDVFPRTIMTIRNHWGAFSEWYADRLAPVETLQIKAPEGMSEEEAIRRATAHLK